MSFVLRGSVAVAAVLSIVGAARAAHADDPVAISGTDLLPPTAPAAGAAPASADVARLAGAARSDGGAAEGGRARAEDSPRRRAALVRPLAHHRLRAAADRVAVDQRGGLAQPDQRRPAGGRHVQPGDRAGRRDDEQPRHLPPATRALEDGARAHRLRPARLRDRSDAAAGRAAQLRRLRDAAATGRGRGDHQADPGRRRPSGARASSGCRSATRCSSPTPIVPSSSTPGASRT